jgi:hypothetical protein
MNRRNLKKKYLLNIRKIIKKDHSDFTKEEKCNFLNFAKQMKKQGIEILPIPNKYKTNH